MVAQESAASLQRPQRRRGLRRVLASASQCPSAIAPAIRAIPAPSTIGHAGAGLGRRRCGERARSGRVVEGGRRAGPGSGGGAAGPRGMGGLHLRGHPAGAGGPGRQASRLEAHRLSGVEGVQGPSGQLDDELPHVGRPGSGILLEGTLHRGEHVGRERGGQLHQRRGLPVHHPVHHLGQRATGEGRLSAQHLVDDGPQGEDVGASVELGVPPGGLLGGHVLRRSHEDRVLGAQRVGAADLGDAEVEHLHPGGGVLLGAAEEDVVGLEVAVDDAGAVRGLERRAHLAGDGQRLVERDPALGEASGQGLPHQVLQHDVRLPGGKGVEVQHLDDVGMPEARGDLRLPAEALEHLVAAGGGVEEHLDRHVLAREPEVLCRPHRAHATAPDESLDSVGLSQDRTHVEHVAS